MGDAVLSPYATIAVKSHVPMTLDLISSNYTKWSASFKAMCGKFGHLRHINSTAAPNPVTDAWAQVDYYVRSWLYGSVADDVLDFTMDNNQTAYQLLEAIRLKFTANHDPRAIFLSHTFHSLT